MKNKLYLCTRWSEWNEDVYGCHGYYWRYSCQCCCSPSSTSIRKEQRWTTPAASASTMCAIAISPQPTSASTNACSASFWPCLSLLQVWWYWASPLSSVSKDGKAFVSIILPARRDTSLFAHRLVFVWTNRKNQRILRNRSILRNWSILSNRNILSNRIILSNRNIPRIQK